LFSIFVSIEIVSRQIKTDPGLVSPPRNSHNQFSFSGDTFLLLVDLMSFYWGRAKKHCFFAFYKILI
jgi:hypothetical protein